MSWDLEYLQGLARERMGDVLRAAGAEVVGTPEKGRATCPVHRGDGLNVSFGNGFATCHSGCGRTFDAVGVLAGALGRDLSLADQFRDTVVDLASILGVRIEENGEARPCVSRPQEARSAPAPTSPSPVDLEARIGRLADRDEDGEQYLRGRGLLVHPLPEFVRFNRGSFDPWLAARERDGFVLAFLAHRVDGTLATLSLRNIRPEGPPAGRKKTLALKDASTSGAAICRKEIALLATGDPEFDRDEIVIAEGGTDALAATYIFDLGVIEGEIAPAWVLGAIGASSAPATVRAFAQVIKGRTVHVALDVDEAGEEWTPKTMAAAWESGAASVSRIRPPNGKDFAEAWRAYA